MSCSYSCIFITGDDTQGRPRLTPSGCSCSLGSVNVKLHGDAAWFLNLFKGKIADAIKSALQGQVPVFSDFNN